MDFTSFCIQTIYIRPKLSEKNPLSNFRSKFTTLFFLFQQLEKKGNKDDNNEYKNTLLWNLRWKLSLWRVQKPKFRKCTTLFERSQKTSSQRNRIEFSKLRPHSYRTNCTLVGKWLRGQIHFPDSILVQTEFRTITNARYKIIQKLIRKSDSRVVCNSNSFCILFDSNRNRPWKQSVSLRAV